MVLPSTPDIFLSYSRRNKEIQQRVVGWLRTRGFSVWVDNEGLTPGTPVWEAEIERAIAAAAAAVVLLSPEAKNSQWVRAETEYAKKNGKRVYPVLIAGEVLTSVPLGLLSHQFIDLRHDEDAGLEALAEALRTYLNQLGLDPRPGPEEQVGREPIVGGDVGTETASPQAGGQLTRTGQLRREKAEQEARFKVEEERLLKEKAELEARLEQQEAARQQAPQPGTRDTAPAELQNDSDAVGLSKYAVFNPALPENWSAVTWVALGWAIAGALGGFMWSEFGPLAAGVISGAIGGLVTGFDLRAKRLMADQGSRLWIIGAWAIGAVVGWTIGWGLLTEAVGAGIGLAVFAVIGLAGSLGIDYLRSNWQVVAAITLVWAVAAALGWSISRGMIDDMGIEYGTSWAIGSAIGWAIAGVAMARLIRKP
jgi:TIR domain-containing protein